MKQLVPLLESSDLDDAQELLRSALSDGPRPGSRERTALALGVALSGVATTGVAAGAVGKGMSSGLGLGVASAKGAGGAFGVSQASAAAIAAKWLVVGLTSGGIVASGAALVRPGEANRTDSTTNTAQAPEPAPNRAARQGEIESPATEVPIGTAPALKDRAPSGASPASAQDPGSALPPSAEALGLRKTAGKLGREVELIDAARRAVAAGDGGSALRELDRYERVRETGTLDREARLLRIDALLLRGDRRSASELAESYLEQFPTDAHASRLRELLHGPVKSTER